MRARMSDSQSSIYKGEDFAPEVVARWDEETIRALCQFPEVDLDVDAFVRGASAGADEETASSGGNSTSSQGLEQVLWTAVTSQACLSLLSSCEVHV